MKQRRLLLINSRFLPLIGGGETYVLELMRHFSENGWEVHLATNDSGVGPKAWNGCKVHYVKGFNDNDLRPETCIPALRAVLDNLHPDLVHVHNIMPFHVYSSVVGKGEFPTVLTIHNTPVPGSRLIGNFGNFDTEAIFVRELLTNGKFDKLCRYYLDSYASVAPSIRGNAEVAQYFSPGQVTARKRTATSDGRIRILFPSRIIKRKGIEDSLHAMTYLPDEFELLLPSFASAEHEAYRTKITELINELDLEDKVTVTSERVFPNQMDRWYEQADVVVMPSHYEGFGIAAVEALAYGVPLVATNVGGLAEIVEHEVNGLVVAPERPAEIARAVVRLARDEKLRKRLVSAGLHTANHTYTRPKHMEQIDRVYRSIVV